MAYLGLFFKPLPTTTFQATANYSRDSRRAAAPTGPHCPPTVLFPARGPGPRSAVLGPTSESDCTEIWDSCGIRPAPPPNAPRATPAIDVAAAIGGPGRGRRKTGRPGRTGGAGPRRRGPGGGSLGLGEAGEEAGGGAEVAPAEEVVVVELVVELVQHGPPAAAAGGDSEMRQPARGPPPLPVPAPTCQVTGELKSEFREDRARQKSVSLLGHFLFSLNSFLHSASLGHFFFFLTSLRVARPFFSPLNRFKTILSERTEAGSRTAAAQKQRGPARGRRGAGAGPHRSKPGSLGISSR